MHSEINKMFENMFKNSTNYISHKTFKIDFSDDLIKALDYFEIDEERLESDLKFLVKFLVEMWKGEHYTDNEFFRFHELCNKSETSGYILLVLTIMKSFRIVRQRYLHSKLAYDDMCKALNLCLDISKYNKDLLFPSELLQLSSTYGYKE